MGVNRKIERGKTRAYLNKKLFLDYTAYLPIAEARKILGGATNTSGLHKDFSDVLTELSFKEGRKKFVLIEALYLLAVVKYEVIEEVAYDPFLRYKKMATRLRNDVIWNHKFYNSTATTKRIFYFWKKRDLKNQNHLDFVAYLDMVGDSFGIDIPSLALSKLAEQEVKNEVAGLKYLQGRIRQLEKLVEMR